MKHFYLVENNKTGKLAGGCQLMKSYLEERGATVTVKNGRPSREDIPVGTECIITIGGDGTLMRTADVTVGTNIPIIGVNAGHLGYLTSASRTEELVPMMDRLLEDRYTIEKRSMLMGYWKDEEGEHMNFALNDITVKSDNTAHAVRLELAVGGETVNEYSGDGIIVATPTGTTAYNVAAGGPIIEAAADVMVITSICPHALSARPMVINMSNVIRICSVRRDAEVAFDGKVRGEFREGSTIIITRAEYEMPMIRLEGDSYFRTLRKKLGQLS